MKKIGRYPKFFFFFKSIHSKLCSKYKNIYIDKSVHYSIICNLKNMPTCVILSLFLYIAIIFILYKYRIKCIHFIWFYIGLHYILIVVSFLKFHKTLLYKIVENISQTYQPRSISNNRHVSTGSQGQILHFDQTCF